MKLQKKSFWLALCASSMISASLWAADDMPIDITFEAEGLGSNVESVTVMNLTHTPRLSR